MRQPDVLLLCAGAGIGGMERVVRNLARELVRRGTKLRVILPEEEAALQTQAWFYEGGVDSCISPALKHAFGHRRANIVPKLRAVVREVGAPVVNIHYGMNFPSLNDVLAVRLAGKRCVVSLHSGGGMDPPAPRLRVLKNSIAMALCSSVVAVSHFQANELVKRGIDKRKIHVIPCGVSSEGTTMGRSQARQVLGLPEDAFIVGTAARLTERKGIADLVRAVSLLALDKQRIFLLIAGEGGERMRLEAMAGEMLPGRCRFAGRLSPMTPFYAACDLFALPSFEESFGIVYAEAALHGVPSIGTAVGGVPEVIVNGTTGLLVPPRDPGRLAEAIQSLLDRPDLRYQMGRDAQARAMAEFTAQRMADRYEHLLLPSRSLSQAARQSDSPNSLSV